MQTWPTEMMDVDELASKAAPFNPRVLSKAARERLEASLREFGMAGTIVFNSRTQTVLGGHQRLSLLQEAGVQRVAVTTVDVPAEKEAALCIQLNREDSMGTWDREKLDSLLAELSSATPDLLESLRLDELPEYKSSDLDRLLDRIRTEPEYQPSTTVPDPEVLAEALASRIRSMSASDLGGAVLVSVSTGSRDILVLTGDPSHENFVSEVRRAAESGDPSPLERLFDALV